MATAARRTPRFYLAVDINLLDEEWLDECGPEEAGAWLFACLLAKKNMTDGVVRRRLLARHRVSEELIDRLLEVGAFTEVSETEVMVTDFLATNLSAEEIDAERKDARRRKAKSRAAQSVTGDDGDVTCDSDVTDCDLSQTESSSSSISSAEPSSSSSGLDLALVWDQIARWDLTVRKSATHLPPVGNDVTWLATARDNAEERHATEVGWMLDRYEIPDEQTLAEVLEGKRRKNLLTPKTAS